MAESSSENRDPRLRSVSIESVYDQRSVHVGKVSQRDVLRFAKEILCGLLLLVVFVFGTSYASAWLEPSNDTLTNVVNTILDITKTAVPSIVTLVLGFYFGRKDSSRPNDDDL